MSGQKDLKRKVFAPRAMTLFLAGAAIVISVAAGGFVLAYARSSIADQTRIIAERDKLFAHTLARSIDIYVGGTSRSVDQLARAVGRGALTREVIDPQIDDVLTGRRELFVLMVVDLDGNTIAGLAPDAADESSKHLVGVNLADRPYFQEVLATKKSVVSDAIFSKVLARPTVAIASPVFDEKKNLVGVVAGALRLDVLYDLADYALGSEFAVPVVVDRSGHALVHPDGALIASARLLGAYEPAKRALKGEEGFLPSFIDVDGKERSAAYMPISGLGWGVWVAQDVGQFVVLRNKVFAAIMPWAGLATAGVLILFTLIMAVTHGPMRRLAEDTRMLVDRGDLDARVSPQGSVRIREVEEFADSFNGFLGAVRKMRDDLGRANAAKSRFLTVATHAFRTPISVASWTLDMMMSDIGTYNADQRSQIMQLLDADKRIQLGFANLFAAMELQGGSPRADLRKGALAETLRHAIDRLGSLASSRSVAFTVDRNDSFDSVFDEKKMSFTFDVILANAVFYNRKDGSVRIALRQEGDSAVVTVEDTGIGIPREELPLVFDPFYRGEKATKKFTDGTGLGLHIAKAYAELHGGSIEVASTDGEWTRVTVKIPLRPRVA